MSALHPPVLATDITPEWLSEALQERHPGTHVASIEVMDRAEVTNAHGLLKAEMRVLGSMILRAADEARVPAGSALAVDRDVFSAGVHDRILAHSNIRVERGEVAAHFL